MISGVEYALEFGRQGVFSVLFRWVGHLQKTGFCPRREQITSCPVRDAEEGGHIVTVYACTESEQFERFSLSGVEFSQRWRKVFCAFSRSFLCALQYIFKTVCHTVTEILHPLCDICFCATFVVVVPGPYCECFIVAAQIAGVVLFQ